VRRRGQEKHILYRDLDGFFEHVWSVHPFATMLTSDAWGPRYGKPDTYEIGPRHTLVEGRFGRFAWLGWLPPLNFLLGQAGLFIHLLKLIRRNRIGAIRAPSPLYLGLFGLCLARLAGVPLVIRVGANHDELREFTGKPIEPRLLRSRRVEKWIERFVFPRADLVAGANQNNLDFALANGARPERSTLFRYGNLIDPRHFVDPSRRQTDPAILDELGLRDRPFLITIARLEDTASVKHPDDVIRLIAALARDGIDAKAMIVGEGPLRSRLVALAGELGVADRVIMPGSRSQEWLAHVFPYAAVHVCPHAGRALSEAALAEVPTVAYDIDWQRELIETGKTGILVAYRDLDGLIEGTRRLLEDRTMAAELGANLRRRALHMLDPERLNSHEKEQYARLLGAIR
jgi:glycosyltransferase involved in cell wall biosynthesis